MANMTYASLRRSASACLFTVVAIGCSASSQGASPGDGPANGGPSATDPSTQPEIDRSLLGAQCTASCAGDVCANTTHPDTCPAEYCVYDAHTDAPSRAPEAYCTAPCDAARCPDGYACEAAEISAVLYPEDTPASKVCMKTFATCGNGKKEYGEACDDGNTAGGDRCSADCAKADPPRIALALEFGAIDFSTQSFPYSGKVEGAIPQGGDGEGCGAAAATREGDVIAIEVDVCDAKSGGHVRVVAKVPAKVGKLEGVAHGGGFAVVDGVERKLEPAGGPTPGVLPDYVGQTTELIQDGEGVRGTLLAAMGYATGPGGEGEDYWYKGTFELVPQ